MASMQHMPMRLLAVLVMFCFLSVSSIDNQRTDTKKNDLTSKDHHGNEPAKRVDKYLNYLRLPEGECYNCSTYKCTNHTSNLGGSEWCIMLFEDAITHCNSDSDCGGYTMTTAQWFHKQYDKNGQAAVHLHKIGQKTIACPLNEWSSYEKQRTIRKTPVTYGRTTCDDEDSCKIFTNVNYVFVSNSYPVNNNQQSYLCQGHPNNLGDKNIQCILSMIDGIQLCNSDENCQGFMVDTSENWQKLYSKNGIQAILLFGQGITYTPNQSSHLFKKQQQ